MRSIKEEIRGEVGISARHFYYLLDGRRNAGLRTAIKIARATGTRPVIWMRGRNKTKRVKAIAAEIDRRIKKL